MDADGAEESSASRNPKMILAAENSDWRHAQNNESDSTMDISQEETIEVNKKTAKNESKQIVRRSVMEATKRQMEAEGAGDSGLDGEAVTKVINMSQMRVFDVGHFVYLEVLG